jgi:hypothetical protein
MVVRNDRDTAAKKLVDDGKKLQADAVAEFNAGIKGAKPTPTPEECDAAVLGHPLEEHEDDGSGPERYPPQPHLGRPVAPVGKAMGAAPDKAYHTREAEPKKAS